MQFPVKIILGVLLLPAVLLLSSPGLAGELFQDEEITGAVETVSVTEPDLADFVPLAAELSGRLTALENRVQVGPDIQAIEKAYNGIKADLEASAHELQRVKELKGYKYNKLVRLRETIQQANDSFGEISKPVNKAIRQIGALRKEWLAEKERWDKWHASLQKEGALDPLKGTFDKANRTIDAALDLVLPQLDAMLTLQEKAGHIHSKIKMLAAEVDALIRVVRRGTLLNQSPPMLSPGYFSQFKSSELWYTALQGVNEISIPSSRFFAKKGWIVLFQGMVTLFVIVFIYRNRRVLTETEHWRYLTVRPFSAGLFLGFMATFLILEYEGVPPIVKLVNTGVAGISFARLYGGMTEEAWKRQYVYGVMIILIITRLLDQLDFPLPLFRLYTVLTSLTAIFFFLWSARKSTRPIVSDRHTWLNRLGTLFFGVIIIAELWGKKTLSLYLFVSSIRSVATVLVFLMFMHIIRGGLEWLYATPLLRRVAVKYSFDRDVIVRRTARFLDAVIWGLILLPGLLVIWGLYDTLEGATRGVLTLGFTLGSQQVSVGLVIVSVLTLYGSFLASWILQKLLMTDLLVKQRVERGTRLSIARLASYVIIFIGFLLALSVLGIEVTKITIMLSALGVGIGFGLQGIVNNFVCGLILLFEQPVRVGDTIEIGGKWTEIKKIGLRATTVETVDQADLIVPNADMINNQVTNWTLHNRRVRLIVPVGVAYGSDVPLVIETLVGCCHENKMVADFPKPQVLFLTFGESSLEFELRVWVLDVDNRLRVRSDLHQQIDRRFREANIEISFPQRDLHVRSVDESVFLGSLVKTPTD